MPERNKNLLVITSSGGGGHLQAAKAKVYEATVRYPQKKIVQRDLLLDWIGHFFGRFFVHLYDTAMKNGHVHVQERLVKCQRILDLFFWPWIFLKAFTDIMKHEIDEVIDTQPLGTSAIIKALRLASFFNKKPLVLEKIITELPTEKVTHFFKPIKRLSEKDRTLIRIISAKPLEGQQTAEIFWQKQCNLSEKKISYHQLPLRPSFHRFLNLDLNTDPLNIPIKLNRETELDLVMETIEKGSIEAEKSSLEIHLTIHPEENVFTLMLGSQPAERATLKYVENFIKITQNSLEMTKKNHLFVFCGNHQDKSKSLLKRIHSLVLETDNYPKNLTIIPMPFQDDSVIAPLFTRSNATFTRSGGLTSLELMSVAKGQIWIHAEINKNIRQFRKKHSESVITGMLSWEQGNAFYLQCVKGAKIISPDTLSKSLKTFYG